MVETCQFSRPKNHSLFITKDSVRQASCLSDRLQRNLEKRRRETGDWIKNLKNQSLRNLKKLLILGFYRIKSLQKSYKLIMPFEPLRSFTKRTSKFWGEGWGGGSEKNRSSILKCVKITWHKNEEERKIKNFIRFSFL